MNDGDWSVLVMDPGSTNLMSAVCRVSEILNFGVACAPPPPDSKPSISPVAAQTSARALRTSRYSPLLN